MAKRVEIPQNVAEKLTPWYSEEFIRNTPVLNGTFCGWFFGLFRQAGVTINKKIHLTKRAPVLTSRNGIVLLGHEMYHVIQQQEMGWWSFILWYLWHWRPSHIKQGRKHPLEEPAYARGDEINDTLAL